METKEKEPTVIYLVGGGCLKTDVNMLDMFDRANAITAMFTFPDLRGKIITIPTSSVLYIEHAKSIKP